MPVTEGTETSPFPLLKVTSTVVFASAFVSASGVWLTICPSSYWSDATVPAFFLIPRPFALSCSFASSKVRPFRSGTSIPSVWVSDVSVFALLEDPPNLKSPKKLTRIKMISATMMTPAAIPIIVIALSIFGFISSRSSSSYASSSSSSSSSKRSRFSNLSL